MCISRDKQGMMIDSLLFFGDRHKARVCFGLAKRCVVGVSCGGGLALRRVAVPPLPPYPLALVVGFGCRPASPPRPLCLWRARCGGGSCVLLSLFLEWLAGCSEEKARSCCVWMGLSRLRLVRRHLAPPTAPQRSPSLPLQYLCLALSWALRRAACRRQRAHEALMDDQDCTRKPRAH